MRARVLVAAVVLAFLAGCSSPGDPHDPATDRDSAAPLGRPQAAATPPVAPDAPVDDAPPATVSDGPAPAEAAPAGFVPPEQRRPFRDDIKVAPLGTPHRASILDRRADATRVDDPERDAVLRGRRLVAPLEGHDLADGFPSAQALAEAILERTLWDDFDAMLSLRVARSEFDALFWPEFPQSRPATGIAAGDAWAFHDAACRDGVTAILSTFGRAELHFTGLRFETGFSAYTNFDLYRGVVIEAVDDRGDPVEIRAAPVFAERNGRWRVYMFDA